MFNQIRNLEGGEIYLITSLLLFMVFFIVVALYLFKLSKQHITEMSNLPIDNQQTPEYEEA